jgi:hypothetical protein
MVGVTGFEPATPTSRRFTLDRWFVPDLFGIGSDGSGEMLAFDKACSNSQGPPYLLV